MATFYGVSKPYSSREASLSPVFPSSNVSRWERNFRLTLQEKAKVMIPTPKRQAIGITPRLMFPVRSMTRPERRVPRNEAPFPKMSRMPKRHPDSSSGTILAKYERERAWMPPWKRPTTQASSQNCQTCVMKMAKTAIPV